MLCDYEFSKMTFGSGTRLAVQPSECAFFVCVLCPKFFSVHCSALLDILVSRSHYMGSVWLWLMEN